MVKIIKSILDVELIKKIAIFTLAYSVLFNLFPAMELSLHKDKDFISNAYNFGYYFSNMFLVTLVVLWGITINTIINYLLIILFFIIGIISNYHLYLHRNFITSETIQNFAKTDLVIFNPFDLKLIFLSIFTIAVSIYSIKHFKVETSQGYLMKILALFCFLLTIYNVIVPYNMIINHTTPMLFLNRLYYAF